MVSPRSRLPFLLALLILVLFSACLPLRYPRPGEPVAVRPGEALVFGRIRVLDAEKRHEFLPFSRDPLDHMLKPDPIMTLELRRFEKPGGAVVYKTHLTPTVEKNGSFYWILPSGDYLLAGNPRIYGSDRFDPGETAWLARFRIPAGGGAIYLGTLMVTIGDGLFNLENVLKKGETEYVVRDRSVVDDREEELLPLRERFQAIPKPVVTELMIPERD